jgi:nitrate/nitrite transporter NarK
MMSKLVSLTCPYKYDTDSGKWVLHLLYSIYFGSLIGLEGREFNTCFTMYINTHVCVRGRAHVHVYIHVHIICTSIYRERDV